jgi:hypothetical protein
MPSKVDSIGTYIFEVKESGLTTTKNGFPQWVARLKATKKYVETPEDMKHFSLDTPGYVDWSSFDEETVAFLVLFKSKDEFSKDTALLNYEQLQLATGWDGTEFDSLINGTMIGKSLLGRIEHNSYTNPETGKVSEGLRVSWIDAETASPERQLKTLDAAEVKGLAAKLKITKTVKPAAAPAKPATAKPAATKPTPAATPAPAPAPAAPAAPATPAAPKPPSSKKKAVAPTPPPAEEQPEDTTTLPGEVSQSEAWEYVNAHKGGNSDTVIEEAWIAACSEVLLDRDEDSATRQDWAKVRDTIIKDCVLSK